MKTDTADNVPRLVVVESPYRGGDARCIAYARAALADCLSKNEAPFASHLLYTQPGVLKDSVPAERLLGLHAGWAFHWRVDAVVFYTDLGISEGVALGIEHALTAGCPVEYRTLDAWTPRKQEGKKP